MIGSNLTYFLKDKFEVGISLRRNSNAQKYFESQIGEKFIFELDVLQRSTFSSDEAQAGREYQNFFHFGKGCPLA